MSLTFTPIYYYIDTVHPAMNSTIPCRAKSKVAYTQSGTLKRLQQMQAIIIRRSNMVRQTLFLCSVSTYVGSGEARSASMV